MTLSSQTPLNSPASTFAPQPAPSGARAALTVHFGPGTWSTGYEDWGALPTTRKQPLPFLQPPKRPALSKAPSQGRRLNG